MKKTYIKTILGTAILTTFLMSCSDVLEEQPRSIYEPSYFRTENGVIGGVTALYAHMRYLYGNGYWLNACETGTDEYTYGHGADANYLAMDMTGQASLDASSSRSDVLWGQALPNINNASGIIENGAAAGVADALIAEARFFRAFDYFLLVQTFGGVPLDLGQGELKFNDQPSRVSVRNTVPETEQ